ncbi:sporulation protein YabP [Desulfitispora alkaliphila]|uniref:sporulation protein YabP n=1 Tax=Desulfitispora alkaliphila TaxID=622674 RepID=UPI003D19FD1A
MEGEKDVQSIKVFNRKKVEVTGVVNVESFDDDQVILETKLGVLVIKGENLHMSELNLDNGIVTMSGSVASMEYSEDKNVKNKGKGFLKKILR